jgi:pimeloyl-ACP methyl ester carboxylesterase
MIVRHQAKTCTGGCFADSFEGRGFSRSYLSAYEGQDYEHRLETDAEDVAQLVKHLSKDPVVVFGSSFGAVVALEVLQQHPDVVKTLIVHEPQACSLLPDCDDIQKRIHEIYKTYRKSGLPPAYRMLGEYVKLHQQEAMAMLEGTKPENGQYNFSNAQYFWEREPHAYPFHHFDLAALEKQKGKLVLVNSQQTDHEALHYRPNVALGEKFGLRVDTFPGGHMGYLTNTKEFADKLLGVL